MSKVEELKLELNIIKTKHKLDTELENLKFNHQLKLFELSRQLEEMRQKIRDIEKEIEEQKLIK